MFQDIQPHGLCFEPGRGEPGSADHVLFLKDGRFLLDDARGTPAIPSCQEARSVLQSGFGELIYLLSAGDAGYYYSPSAPAAFGSYRYKKPYGILNLKPQALAFATATAFHLAIWYAQNRHCGHCAGPLLAGKTERALHCPSCGAVKYPRISPVVIVGVRDGERLLLVKNASGEYRNYGLIAGFVEPGETLEAAMAREVLEETGLSVKNPRYYKSQPWAFSQSLLMGFFADLDGDGAITLDAAELSEAAWFLRLDLPSDESRSSLTWDMIQAFRNAEV
jgi:NAD+ diphosphatase